jgi:hypothetical protein
VDAERFLVGIEDAKLRGAHVDPAAGKMGFGEWAERWYLTTAHLKPSTRHDYRMLLDHQVLPAFGDWILASIDPCREGVAGRPPRRWAVAKARRQGAPGALSDPCLGR